MQSISYHFIFIRLTESLKLGWGGVIHKLYMYYRTKNQKKSKWSNGNVDVDDNREVIGLLFRFVYYKVLNSVGFWIEK